MSLVRVDVKMYMREYFEKLENEYLTKAVHKSTLKGNMIDDFLTLDELAEILKVKKVTLYRMARVGKIPAVKFGKSWRVSSRFVEDLHDGKEVE